MIVHVELSTMSDCIVCVVSDECDVPTSYLVQSIVAHCCKVMYFGCFDFRGEIGFLNCDDVCRE